MRCLPDRPLPGAMPRLRRQRFCGGSAFVEATPVEAALVGDAAWSSSRRHCLVRFKQCETLTTAHVNTLYLWKISTVMSCSNIHLYSPTQYPSYALYSCTANHQPFNCCLDLPTPTQLSRLLLQAFNVLVIPRQHSYQINTSNCYTDNPTPAQLTN